MSMFPFPDLLTHPNIPKPLHSVNPRSILGKEWWDEQRQRAYAKYDYHCWACGIHKNQAQYHRWLEAHEKYNINYEQGVVTLSDIVALCHACHNFIHSGRLWIHHQDGAIPEEKILRIYKRGFGILKRHDLKPFWGTAYQYLLLKGYSEEAALKIVADKGLLLQVDQITEWSKWRLVLNGKEYYSPFKDEAAWEKHYSA